MIHVSFTDRLSCEYPRLLQAVIQQSLWVL